MSQERQPRRPVSDAVVRVLGDQGVAELLQRDARHRLQIRSHQKAIANDPLLRLAAAMEKRIGRLEHDLAEAKADAAAALRRVAQLEGRS